MRRVWRRGVWSMICLISYNTVPLSGHFIPYMIINDWGDLSHKGIAQIPDCLITQGLVNGTNTIPVIQPKESLSTVTNLVLNKTLPVCPMVLRFKIFIVQEEFWGISLCHKHLFFITYTWIHITQRESVFLLKAHRCLSMVALFHIMRGLNPKPPSSWENPTSKGILEGYHQSPWASTEVR